MLTDVPGVTVGHWSAPEARTGVTVIVLPPGTTASGEVRGGAPATREFALLDPTSTVGEIDAVVLSGGSAFGLAAADGVMAWLEEQERGFETRHGRVPIVVGMSLFDLGVGDPTRRPGPVEGREAASSAAAGPFAVGTVGAGTGATIAKWGGRDRARPGGLVTATIRSDEVVVAALVAVNAVGDVDDGSITADPGPPSREDDDLRTNTTIGVVATNATVDATGCHHLARAAHHGLARAIVPSHTAGDGDAFVAAATGEVEGFDTARLRVLAQHVVTAAIRTLGPG